MVTEAFFENASTHVYEHRPLEPGERESNLVIQFQPVEGVTSLPVARLWDEWIDPNGPTLGRGLALKGEVTMTFTASWVIQIGSPFVI
jgi:hypothetical protein